MEVILNQTDLSFLDMFYDKKMVFFKQLRKQYIRST